MTKRSGPVRALLITIASLLLAAGCGGGRPGSAQGPSEDHTPLQPLVASKTTLGACALQSPLRELGPGRDLPGRVDLEPAAPVERPASATLNAGACAQNEQYLMGSGVQDMTGPAGDSISAGYEAPDHVLRGIHLRQFARAFALRDPCSGRSQVIAVTETGFMTQGTRQTVLDLVAADPELAPHYGPDNIMLSATHTHSGPGGEAHHTAFNLFRLGYDALVHEVYTQAIYKAIRQAHVNLEAHPEPGTIRLALGELLNANDNRSEPAYANNPESERQEWLNQSGEEVRVNKRMLQLRFDRTNGRSIGLLNFFGVHTVSVGTAEPLISSDNKGLAARAFEAMMQTDYLAPEGQDRFVAAFAQSDEGDASPNLCFREHPFPDPRIGCGENTLQSNAAHGVKQLARAIELYDGGGVRIRGELDSRLMHAPMDGIEITDPVILSSLQHPTALDVADKRTCSAALGYSMAAGAEDQRGPSQEGVTCADINLLDALATDIALALATAAANASGSGYPVIPASTVGSSLGCALTGGLGALPGLPDADYSCHAEKPILFPIGTTDFISNSDLPLQIVSLGQLAIVALPWEVTTMAARRIRETVMAELRGAGIDYVVVAALSNDFVQYLTTREEYATQQYEAASTHFGPWTLAAVRQELRQLAISLRDGQPAPAGVPAPRTTPPPPFRLPYIAADARPTGAEFGAVLDDAQESYAPGESVVVRFVGAHPRNDTAEVLNRGYVFAERQVGPEQWEVVAQDWDPGLIFYWRPTPESPVAGQTLPGRQSEIEVIWHVPANLAMGQYRIRYAGTAVPALIEADAGQRQSFTGVSRAFAVEGEVEECPGYPAWF